MKVFLLGVFATLVVASTVGYIGVVTGTLIPANADGVPSKLERWAARRSLDAVVAREAPRSAPPVAADNDTFVSGIKIYGANCIVCHGAADGRPSMIAFGLYQKAPLLGRHGVEDDPEGETFWKVKHGIRLTGMPAFGVSLNDTQLWQVAVFLKHMDSLPPSADAKWKALKNPAAPVPLDKLPAQMRGEPATNH